MKEIRLKWRSGSFKLPDRHGKKDLREVGAAVVGDGVDLDVEAAVGRDFEASFAFDAHPAVRSGKFDIQIARQDLHQLRFGGAEGVITRIHNPQRFAGAVGEFDRAAGHFPVKVLVCFFYDRYVSEFTHSIAFCQKIPAL